MSIVAASGGKGTNLHVEVAQAPQDLNEIEQTPRLGMAEIEDVAVCGVQFARQQKRRHDAAGTGRARAR